jgi:class 3 adenylate cyclase/tetratricopeptide (TPR) repeat protein
MQRVETISVLVTDLVESTRLESRIGPAAADELRQEHFGIIRAAVGATGGDEVKTTGDGLVAVFRAAAGAVGCAVLIQQGMERRNRTADEQLRIRVGIALGDATPEGGDWFGPPAIEAVRLCDKSAGGQILATELVQLVGGREGHAFRDLGELNLKGMARPVRVYEVDWEPARGWTSALPLPARLRAAASGRYVARVDEHRHVSERWAATRGGTRQAVLVEGEPGIGKTRFVGQAARELDNDDVVVLFGHCAEELHAPYGAFIEALSHLVEHAPDEVLEEHVERHGGELSRFIPKLTRRVPSTPTPSRSDPETERYLVFAAVVGFLQQVSAEAPVVLILDDLHWADGPTLALLKHLVAETHGCRILLIGTYRHTDVHRDHRLAQVLADLRREEAVARVALKGLSEAGVAALMELVAGHRMDASGPALATKLTAETDGNPFFVGEILRHLSESGAIKQGPGGRWDLVRELDDLGLPQSVHEVIERRVDRLGADMRRILCAAAVIGRDFEVELLARVVRVDQDELLDALEAAVDTCLVQEHAERGGWYTFAHNLVNHTLYDALGTTRQTRLHRRVAEALEELCGEDPGQRVAELARHWTAAAAPVETEKALHYSRRAGELALERLAPDEGMRFFEQALALLRRRGDDPAERCDLAIGLGEAQRQAGRAGFRETLLAASRVAAELGDADRAARAALANSRGFASTFGDVDAERVTAIERALELNRAAGAARCARLLALLAMELQFDTDHQRRRSLADRALRLARESGDRRILPYVLRDRFHAVWSVDTLDSRRSMAEEMCMLAEHADDPLVRIWALDRTVHAAVESGELPRATEASRRLLMLTDELGQPGLRWHAMYYAAGLAALRGELMEAERLVEAAAARAAHAGEPDGIVVHLSQIGVIRVEQGRADEVVELLEQAVAHNPRIPAFKAGLAATLCELGRTVEASALVDDVADSGFSDLPRDQIWSTALATWARATAAVGCERAAGQLYDLLVPWRSLVVWNGTSGYGSVESFLGMLASTLGAAERAQEHFAAASALHRREGIMGWEARNLGNRALAYLRAGDAAQARAVAGEALRLAQAQGWVASARHAEEVVRDSVEHQIR